MDARTVEQVKDWDSRPFSGGFEALRDLADSEFAGAVRAGGSWLFMLNGRVIGVFDGELADFDAADGTAFEAPHPSLPLLYAMQERGGRTQAKYYTNDTPLSEASDTLSKKGFTGYVELSENVLSGDYYVVYHGGRSMSVAFVGESEQLIAGEEAFERANDEVGIYEVVDVDGEVTEIPEPESSTDDGGAAAGAAADARDDSGPQDRRESTPASRDAGDDGDSPEATGTTEVDTEAAGGSGSPDAGATDAAASQPSETPPSDAAAGGAGTGRSPGESASADVDRDRLDGQWTRDAAGETAGQQRHVPDEGGPAASQEADGTDQEGPLADEQQWRETTTIPSLDPERSSEQLKGARTAGKQAGSRSKGQSRPASQRQPRGSKRQPSKAVSSESQGSDGPSPQELKAELESRGEKIRQLRERLSTVENERDSLREERDDLQAEVERLREELETARAAGESAPTADRDLTRQQALDGTNLFVRYGSKGKGTLEDAAVGEASREEVAANLKLEHHTQFDADAVTVDGEPFEEFLSDSMEYEFANWLVSDLLYEIVDTGNERGMNDVFEAIPDVDRVELRGMVEAADDDGEVYEETFDVVFRDRMGNPLAVANLNDSRDPATGEMLESLVNAASAVGQANDELCGAFEVTRSFFEPAALETTEDVTSGGLLTREKRKSFVKLSRKRGYHLCLVESRDGEFHLNVPEL
ncbi:DUF7527 domain-containing protein [Halomicrococcus sp. NG-SE-24]|uniref:DUF7527 domain-containing protein n=1 Tax=Halomicrococcus sp. NG-SE-24 TaxID=3436928 RepID=UPI003D96BD3B